MAGSLKNTKNKYPDSLSNLFVIYTPLTSKESLKSLRINFHNIYYVKHIILHIYGYIYIYMHLCVYVIFKMYQGKSARE